MGHTRRVASDAHPLSSHPGADREDVSQHELLGDSPKAWPFKKTIMKMRCSQLFCSQNGMLCNSLFPASANCDATLSAGSPPVLPHQIGATATR